MLVRVLWVRETNRGPFLASSVAGALAGWNCTLRETVGDEEVSLEGRGQGSAAQRQRRRRDGGSAGEKRGQAVCEE